MMNKQIATTAVLFALATGASGASAQHHEPGYQSVGQGVGADVLIQKLDPVELETTRGGMVPLAIALGIASIDLALAGFYWGVYVPYYAPQDPSFDPSSVR